MKRKLLTQIKNEWRDNIWLVVELVVVCGVLWIMALLIYGTVKGTFEPTGSDYEDVYLLGPAVVAESSPHHIAVPEGETDPYNNDFRDLLRRLRENPNVEAVGFHNNAVPYNYNFSGTNYVRVDEPDSVVYFGNRRQASPDMVKVLGFESMTGKTPDQLVEMLRRGELLISNNPSYEQQGRNPFDLIGKQMVYANDSSRVYRVGDVIRNVRRSDYEPAWAGTIIYPLSEDNQPWGRIALKVKHGHDQRFKEDFRTHPELRKQRNVYFTDFEKLSDVREGCQREIVTSMRMLYCLMGFLFVTVFLGLLGTFWFRMQQRVGEIAIRKVCGATRRDIFARIISEGMILLACAAVVTSAIVWPFTSEMKSRLGCSVGEMIVFEAITIGLVAIGIVLSLWYPARKAMAIEPAIALKSE